jgi:hypothetical protein
MSKTKLLTIISVIGIAAIALTAIPFAKASSGHSDHKQVHKMDMKKHIESEPLSLGKIHSTNLPMVSQSIDKAIKAVEAGDKKTALVELHKAQEMLSKINTDIAKHVKPKFANVRCPIMGAPINPDKVVKNLTRDYKDKKIAFCCAGCPATWDKLTDAEKDGKLAKVKPKPIKSHSGHKH